MPVVPVTAVGRTAGGTGGGIDTTGAGDVHTGVFLAALLRGASPVDAARGANAVAGAWVATGSYGG